MISVSMLSGYLYCPRKVFLQYVLKLQEPPKESLVLGTVRHHCYDAINKSEEHIVRSIQKGSVFEDIQTIYKREHLRILREAVANNQESIVSVRLHPEEVFLRNLTYIMFESRQRATHLHHFIKKNDVFGDELWNILTPKVISELKVESQLLGVRGIIDQIEVHPDKKIPIELKTGTAPREGVWPGHKIQVSAYGLLMEEHFQESVEEGFVTYLDVNDRRKVPFNIFLKEEIKDLIHTVNRLIESKKVPPILTERAKCKSCGLRDQCYNEDHINALVKELRDYNEELEKFSAPNFV